MEYDREVHGDAGNHACMNNRTLSTKEVLEVDPEVAIAARQIYQLKTIVAR